MHAFFLNLPYSRLVVCSGARKNNETAKTYVAQSVYNSRLTLYIRDLSNKNFKKTTSFLATMLGEHSF